MVGTELEWSPREWSAELGKNLSRTRTEDVAQWVKCLPSVLERLELILSLEMWCWKEQAGGSEIQGHPQLHLRSFLK